MSSVRGKVAVVTGAGSGIGRALALGLAQRGARLALCDVDPVGLGETAEMVGTPVHTERVDVSDRAAVAAYATAVAGHYGVVHQLYNNAGVGALARPLAETDYATFERLIDINLWGVIHGTKEFLPHLIASGDGHVVTLSSLNGILAQPNMTAYCTTKFAVRGFTESLRAELLLHRHPVAVTVVHPGGVRTNIRNAVIARTGPLDPEAARRNEVYESRLFRTTPDEAARQILTGVERGKGRVLIGQAHRVDRIVRLLPALYPRVVARWERRTFSG
jgi:NAD(P)-dependent dehydrogenase (short-subunit alcohol dehydrogenase family)